MSTAVHAVGAKGRLLATGRLAGEAVIRQAADLSLDRNPLYGDYTGPPAGCGFFTACGLVATVRGRQDPARP